MKKNGFVLMETIMVISILSVILLMLFTSYYTILSNVKKDSLYDNTEYIYKTTLVRKFIRENINPEDFLSENLYTYCSNYDDSNLCYNELIVNDEKNDFLKTLGVEAIHITPWNTEDLDSTIFMDIEATTQQYIKFLDPKDDTGYRIIVMYKNENGQPGKFQYASLKL